MNYLQIIYLYIQKGTLQRGQQAYRQPCLRNRCESIVVTGNRRGERGKHHREVKSVPRGLFLILYYYQFNYMA